MRIATLHDSAPPGKVPPGRGWRLTLEWKWQDLWVGAFLRRERNHHLCVDFLDVWVCLVPCLLIHLTRWRTDVSPYGLG